MVIPLVQGQLPPIPVKQTRLILNLQSMALRVDEVVKSVDGYTQL